MAMIFSVLALLWAVLAIFKVVFAKPEKKLYLEIVHELAERNGITLPTEQLDRDAEAFALNRGHRSARAAEQFIDSLL